MKNKINKYCSFPPEIQLKFLLADLRLNLSQCLDDMVPFRLYQMKKIVIRSEDASIINLLKTSILSSIEIYVLSITMNLRWRKYLATFIVYLKPFAYNVAFLQGKRFVSILYIKLT